MLLWQQIYRVRLYVLKKNAVVLCEQQATICESSSIMMRDSPHSSKLLMSLFLVDGLTPVSGLHVGLTEDVEHISQLILI